VSKADELRLLRDAIKSFPDALAIWSAEERLIACSDLYARLAAAAPGGGEVAERLSGCLRKADTLARAGADEFAIVVCDLKEESDCRIIADKLVQALAAEFRVGGRRLRLGVSIGISLSPADGGDGEALLRNADAAMDRAKQLGRNQIRFFGR
jgi:predicted signal transduction protein with EAL and GGDEF domain